MGAVEVGAVEFVPFEEDSTLVFGVAEEDMLAGGVVRKSHQSLRSCSTD